MAETPVQDGELMVTEMVETTPSDQEPSAVAPSAHTKRGTFARGHTLNRGRTRKDKLSLQGYIQKKCGTDGHAIVNELVRLSSPKTRENGKPIPLSIRMKAHELLLDRGWGKTGPATAEISHQPIFNLPPGSHVAIAITTPSTQTDNDP